LDKNLKFIKIEVTTIACLGSHTNLTNSPTGTSSILLEKPMKKTPYTAPTYLFDLKNSGTGTMLVKSLNLPSPHLLPLLSKGRLHRPNKSKQKILTQMTTSNKKMSRTTINKVTKNNLISLQNMYPTAF
jgi:hypothetical protein